MIGERSTFSDQVVRIETGKTWKRRPKAKQVAPGAIVVEVELNVPTDRLDHVVSATVDSPRAIS